MISSMLDVPICEPFVCFNWPEKREILIDSNGWTDHKHGLLGDEEAAASKYSETRNICRSASSGVAYREIWEMAWMATIFSIFTSSSILYITLVRPFEYSPDVPTISLRCQVTPCSQKRTRCDPLCHHSQIVTRLLILLSCCENRAIIHTPKFSQYGQL